VTRAPRDDNRRMVAFEKSVRLQEKTRRYSIASTDAGWEVREERYSRVVRKVHLTDWHRVERERRSIAIQLDTLKAYGWTEEGKQ
jgi:hypothetical protein